MNESSPTTTSRGKSPVQEESSEEEEEEEEPPTSTMLATTPSAPGSEQGLVQGSNTWLPAYGFQLQHSHFQPTHEDLRANDTMLVQQIEFLETILEETSDDLQSDSDRSGTTYWLGSDSEAESVIHIGTHRGAEGKLDGSGSECNSVVPKKRRRRNGAGERENGVVSRDDNSGSPRSSRSSGSSRSSSLLQFESLERTCATISPSSYSFDSLEYCNRSNSHFGNTSPDSLEQDYDRVVPNGFPGAGERIGDGLGKIRPYRSFESLDTCQKEDDARQRIGNGFSLHSERSRDFSRTRKLNDHRRDFWHQEDDDDDDDYGDYEDAEDEEEPDDRLGDSREELAEYERFEDRMVFGDVTSNYATSLDCRNTIDLREIGIETKRDALFDLKSGQAATSAAALLQSRLNIAGNTARTGGQQGWSKASFNFRFTDKSQSAPSLPSSVLASGFAPRDDDYASRCRGSSSDELFENYTRVSSVPVDLHLCGASAQNALPASRESLNPGDREEKREMADMTVQDDATPTRRPTVIEDGCVRKTSVRTQNRQVLLTPRECKDASDEEEAVENERAEGEEQKVAEDEKRSPTPEEPLPDCQLKRVKSTVKTQHKSDTLEIGLALDSDIDAVADEAIKQFKREIEGASAAEAAPTKLKHRPKSVKNNASYELAQQFEVDERNFMRMPSCSEAEAEGSPRSAPRRKVQNNASYELAQQIDLIKALQQQRPFLRMDACDELEEPGSSSSHLKVQDFVDEMSRGYSAANLATENQREPAPVTRTYSKSVENVSAASSKAKPSDAVSRDRRKPQTNHATRETPKRSPRSAEQQESILSQIKKNSDLFSIYGEGASPPMVDDDEVDSPCLLENKPIESSSSRTGTRKTGILEGEANGDFCSDRIRLLAAVTDEKSANDAFLAVERWHIFATSDPSAFPTNGAVAPSSPGIPLSPAALDPHKISFIGEFYPEKSLRLRGNDGRGSAANVSDGHVERQEISGNRNSPPWNTEKPSSRSSSSASGGERFGRRGEEERQRRQQQQQRYEEEEDSVEEGEEGREETATRQGHNVDSVVCGPPPIRRGSESRRSRSGKAGLDTNRMDNDNKHLEAAVREEMSTMPKRDAASETPTPQERKKGLGGFLQRFSRLRFSGRSKVPRSEVHNKKSDDAQVQNRAKVQQQTKVGGAEVNAGAAASANRKKEPDYIIIPLHPPEGEVEEEEERRKQQQNGQSLRDDVFAEGRRAEQKRPGAELERSASSNSSYWRSPVSSKPPLPPQPPRATALGARSTSSVAARRRAATDLGCPAAIEMAKARTMQAGFERPVGLLETDLDAADASEGVATPAAAATAAAASGKKTRSLLNLNHTRPGRDQVESDALHAPQLPGGRTTADASVASINQRPHKSMEFLLDKENLHFVKPPENELQKVGERVPSEHELRVQRSLQRLNVPDWYKNSPSARDGFRLKRHSDASQHGGWRALGSKTTSLSSLTSSSNRQPTTGALLSPSPTPPVFSRWSTSLLNSAGSSPASSARSSFNHRQPYLGWRSQERLANPRTPAERLAQGILPQLQSASKQPQEQQQQQQPQTTNQQLEVRNSIKEVTSAIVHYVQSGQEVGGGGRLSPRPRPDDWDDRGGARSTSPRGSVKLCWMESSFVGSRPVDSPETPMSLATDAECCAGCNATTTESCSCVDSATSGLFLDLTPTRDGSHLGTGLSPSSSSNHHLHHHHQQPHHRGSEHSDTEEAMATAALLRNKPSPGSTTLEDVLDSLLGLPSASRTPSPGPGSGSASVRQRSSVNASANAGKSCSDLRQDLQESAKTGIDGIGLEERPSYYVGELIRRKSEGSDTIPVRGIAKGSNLRHRRVSFDNVQENGSIEKLIRCRNNKCNNVTTVAEARRTYKSCHNCTCLYCSRDCRRAHWQRHRRTCLHSRAGTLCRQVLSAAKEDPNTLRHVSALARRGHTSHGRGAVKCFFPSPEAAEQFVGNGFVDLGEPTYVRWSDLLPSEMGAELYAEVMRLCKSYNPETRLVLYVAVCVVSEVPTSGAVKWERQLVSRCAKIRLDSSYRQPAATLTVSAMAPSNQSQTGRQEATSPCNITREMDSPETLVLTSLPGSNGQNTPKRAREISFTNIQRQLTLRGVSLRRHFPQVYKKLCSYVDGSVDKFAPVTIYPRDQASGKSFMCIIMLDAEPERLQLLPTDSSRVRTVDISKEQE